MKLPYRPRLSGNLPHAYEKWTKKESRVLVIGDTHHPFCIEGYLEFCIETYKTFNCNRVVHIGDVIDNHYSSYHETDPDGFGGGEELERAIEANKPWYKAFPEAEVLLGNHDVLIARQAKTNNIPAKWIKSYSEVLECPNWEFKEELVIDDVLYTHGIGSKAHMKAQKNMLSTVQGHHHTECYTHWYVGKKQKVFGMQVGCGIDIKSYAMAYAKWFPKPAIGCGVVIGGHTGINVMMDL